MNRIIFTILCLITAVSCNVKLSVLSPQELKQEIEEINKNLQKEDETAIDCKLLNLGSVPYGTRTIGEFHLAKPYNACNQDKVEYTRRPFLLVERGSCGLADKIYNAQESGYKIVVIVDSLLETNKDIQIDNGHGYNVHIPSVFIDKIYGDAIVKFAEKYPGESIFLSIEFIENKYENLNVRLWMDLANPLQSRVIQSFNPMRKKILHYDFKTEPVFDIKKKTQFINPNDSNCILFKDGKEQFCSPNPEQPFATGVDVCVHKQSEELWYEYYNIFGSDCYFAPKKYYQCSVSTLKKLIKFDMQKHIFCINDDQIKYSILNKQAETNEFYQIFEWPAITLNDEIYRGELEGYEIASAICSLKDVNENCQAILLPSIFDQKDAEQQSSKSVFYLTLFLIVLTFVIVFFYTAYIYKRMLRRDNIEDAQKVHKMVSLYIKINGSRGKNAAATDESNIIIQQSIQQ